MNIKLRLAQTNWLADVFTPVAVILMEAMCIYPWLVFLGKWPILPVQRDLLSLPSVLILIGGAYLLTKVVLSRSWPLSLVKMSIVLAGIIFIFTVIRLEYSGGFTLTDGQWFVVYTRVLLDLLSELHPFVMAIPAAFFVYWRGISRAQKPAVFQSVYPAFLFGLVVMSFLVVVWAINVRSQSISDVTGEVGIYIAAFFFFGLTSIALTNLQNIKAKLKNKEGVNAGNTRRWLGILMGIISGVVLLGVGVASAFSSQFIRFLGSVIGFLWNIIEKVAYYIFLPIGYVVGWLMTFFTWLLSLFNRKAQTDPAEGVGAAPLPELPETAPSQLSPELVLFLKWGFFALVLALIIFFLVRGIVQRRALKKTDDIEEENESLWSWTGFKDDFRLWLNSLRPKFGGTRSPAPGDALAWDTGAEATLGVREIYTRFLKYMEILGNPRGLYETPYEFRRRAQAVLPEEYQTITEMTEHYVNNRYGNIDLDSPRLNETNAGWRKLRASLIQKISENRPQPKK